MSWEERFDQAPAGYVLDSAHGFQEIVPYHDVKGSVHPDGLELDATGGDPGIFLRFNGLKPEPVILRVDMESPEETKMQVFYKPDASSGYSEANSMWFSLKKGANTIYVPLEKPWMISNLRIDPGTVKGRYVLNRLEVRTLPGEPTDLPVEAGQTP
jgi:hypothetical protein